MNAARDLGGWVPPGVALSLFWVIGSAYYLTGANKEAYFQSHSKDCLALQKPPPPGFNLWACGADNRAQWQEARSRMWDGVALRALGPVVLAWLLVYGFARFARQLRG
jgi:hypothetical protein